jgi:hypothetical protein
MTTSNRLSLASLLAVFGGALSLSTPAQAAPGAFSCLDSVQGYCDYAAGFCASGRATCYYQLQPCQINNIECDPV